MSKWTKGAPIGNLPVNVNQDIYQYLIRINCSFSCMHYFSLEEKSNLAVANNWNSPSSRHDRLWDVTEYYHFYGILI